MARIYEIYNDINDKVYIGKTECSIETRFKEQCREALKGRSTNRPLYRAMRKYGIEHFYIRLLEETDKPEEREVHWIALKNSYHYGYNATYGGDGTSYVDYDLVVSTYTECQSMTSTAEKLNTSIKTVSKILRSKGIATKSGSEVSLAGLGTPIKQYNLMGEYLGTFPSSLAAARALGKITGKHHGAANHIVSVCRGKRKTAYGYIWKY